jgi:hypothetical protein
LAFLRKRPAIYFKILFVLKILLNPFQKKYLEIIMRKINTRNPLLFVIFLLLAMNSRGQNTPLHYIKFFHIGENLVPVHTLNISFEDGEVPKDSDERVIDTLPPKSIVTDERSYDHVLTYVKKTNFQIGKDAGKLYFGTFKIIADGKYYYLPGNSVTAYFKNMVSYLKRNKCDPLVIEAMVENYPWIFNP